MAPTPNELGAFFIVSFITIAIVTILAIRAFGRNVVRVPLDTREWLYVAGLYLRARIATTFSTRMRPATTTSVQPPRCGTDAITEPWLEMALSRAGLLKDGTAVAGIRLEKLTENRGLRGVMLTLDVQYRTTAETGATSGKALSRAASVAASNQDRKRSRRKTGGAAYEAADFDDDASTTGGRASDAPGPAAMNPAKLILKTVLFHSVEHRYDMLVAGNHREATYYGSDLERLGRFSGGVRVLHAHSSATSGESVIIMEDLRSARPGALGLNYYCGNQVWGIPAEVKAAMAPQKPERLLQELFARAADMHAPFWGDAALMASPWLKGADWYRGENRAAWTLAVKVGRQAWEKAKSFRGAAVLSPALVGIVDRSFAASSWERLQTRLQDSRIPFTLTHGDFHAANALWQPPTARDRPTGELFLVDWSEVGIWEPLTDLGQTMISDVSVEVRRKHERALLRAYWERLTGGPATRATAAALPFERCWELYARHSPERWIFMFALLASMPNLPDSATTYFHDQLLAFITDHAEHAPREGGEITYPMASVVTLGRAI